MKRILIFFESRYPRPIGGPISALPIVQISCNMLHNTAADIEGHVWTWGWGGRGRLGHGNDLSLHIPTVVDALNHASVTQDLQTQNKQNNDEEDTITEMEDLRLNKMLRMSIVVQIACGAEHTLMLTRGGIVYGCGENSNGQLGIGTSNDCRTPTKIDGSLKIQKIEI